MGIGACTADFVTYSDNAPTLAVPPGAEVGEYYLFAVQYESDATITWPDGFSEVSVHAADGAIGTSLRAAIRECDGTESGNFAATIDQYQAWAALCAVVGGVKLPLDSVSAKSVYAYTSTAALAGAEITTTGDAHLVVMVGATGSAGTPCTATLTPPTGFTAHALSLPGGATSTVSDAGDGVAISIAEYVQPMAGPATYEGSMDFGGVGDARAGNVLVLAFEPLSSTPNTTATVSSIDESDTAAAAISISLLTAREAAILERLALLNGLVSGNPLVVGLSMRSAGDLVQSVSTVGSTTTVSTSSAPLPPAATSQLTSQQAHWLEDLAKVFGLAEALTVTPTGRAAGALSQTITETGGVVTVERT